MVAEQSLLHSFVSVDGILSRQQRCAGNPCLLQAFDTLPPDAPAARRDTTQCQSWLDFSSGQPLVAVRCFSTAGDLIQCCGHGLLAAAHSWQRRLQRRALNLSMNGSLVASSREGDITWLRFSGVHTADCAVPEWLEQVFNSVSPVQAAAIAGDAQGYLILQWPDSFDLQQLAPPGEVLSTFTERALICTSARPEWGDGQIQMRYFAPQYGVGEDAATGSAMRVLARYWSPRFHTLTAHQCSPSGGLLMSRHTATYIEVGGRCSVTTAGEHD